MLISIPDSVYTLWDELSEFDAASTEAALAHLQRRLCDLVDAQDSYWVGTVRVQSRSSRDPLCGWRPRAARYLHDLPVDRAGFTAGVKALDADDIDESTRNHARQAGTFRSTLVRDHVSAAWFESAHYARYYAARGMRDVLFVVTPVNRDAESFIAVMRGHDKPFTPADRDLVACAVRGIKWFQRRVLLHYGVMMAEEPLTPTERKIVTGLLGKLSESEIAQALGQSRATTHGYVTTIFRKFGVKSRAGLTSLWLGENH